MKKRLYVVSRDSQAIDAINSYFSNDFKVDVFEGFEPFFHTFTKNRPEFTFMDVDLFVGSDVPIQKLFRVYPTAQIVALALPESTRFAVDFVKEGAADYLNLPIQVEELALMSQRLVNAARKESELEILRSDLWNGQEHQIVDTRSSRMMEALKKIKSVSQTDATVLLTGQTGVGKTAFAKFLHQKSIRKDRQLISVHCGAIPENLIESELFGHEKGAFTGAIKRKLGRFELADGGTIFLDEIGTISPNTQIKLLKVIQEGVFQRVGGEYDINVNVRIVAASNEKLEDLVERKQFRSDLYFRLNVFPIEIPSLIERIEDLPLIARNVLESLNKKYGRSILRIEPKAMSLLSLYSWPGNVRELENLIERAYILERSNELTVSSFPADILTGGKGAVVSLNTELPLSEARKIVLEDFEKQYVQRLLETTGGRISQTARIAGVTVRQIHKIMHKYGLHKEDFRSKALAL